MAAIDLGRLRFYHQGAYNGATTYKVNDVVTYGPTSYVYIANTAAAGNLPTNTAYWSKLSDGISAQTAWTTATVYYPGNVVTRGGQAYTALLAHTSNNFASDLNANKWLLLVGGVRWRGTWATSTSYILNDLVYVDGDVFIATADGTSNSSLFSNDIFWTSYSQGGANVLALQTGNSGKLLTTDGTTTAWTATPSVNTIAVAGKTVIGTNALSFSNTLTNPTLVVQSNTTDYSQIAFRNLGTNANSSTDFIAYSDIGDDDTGWIDIGITSSNFNDPSFTVTGAHDGYVFVEAPANSAGSGSLILATGGNGTQNKIIFAAGGLQSSNTQMVITPNTSVAINIATNSTSATTGALTVAGGVGIGGNVYITGNTNITGTITVGGGAFQSNNLTVSDPIIFMGNTNSGDSFDLGFAGKFTSSGVKYAGLLRDASDSGKFRLFTNLTEAPSSTANFAASSNATLILGNLEASSTVTAATANISGTLNVNSISYDRDAYIRFYMEVI
jgi:hypothetical protein